MWGHGDTAPLVNWLDYDIHQKDTWQGDILQKDILQND